MTKQEGGHLVWNLGNEAPYDRLREDAEVFKRMKAVGAEVKARAKIAQVVARLSEVDKQL
jgi:hypothetical protein